MLRTKLINKFLKKKTLEPRDKYKKRRNICVGLIKKPKRNFYENFYRTATLLKRDSNTGVFL